MTRLQKKNPLALRVLVRSHMSCAPPTPNHSSSCKLLATFNRQDGLNMTHVDLAIAIGPSRQHLRRLKHVLDLPTIEVNLGQHIQLPITQAARLAHERVPD